MKLKIQLSIAVKLINQNDNFVIDLLTLSLFARFQTFLVDSKIDIVSSYYFIRLFLNFGQSFMSYLNA